MQATITMISPLFRKSSAAVFLLATFVAGASIPVFPRSAQICYDTETAAQLCYTAPDNTPQDVVVADITYCAEYLRAYGAQVKAGRLFTILAADGDDCPEWSVYSHGSVLVTAKHIDPAVNSSVLFSDIANTLDGGVSATPAQQAVALIGCGTDGGSQGVLVNVTNPAYNTSTYLAGGLTPNGLIIKVVTTGA